MCGIAGFLHKGSLPNSADLSQAFAKSLNHRGPDHVGEHLFEHGSILNTRLSIIDLAGGNQPFYSQDKKIAVIQNGEIYNFVEVKAQLESEGVKFNTSSDTEVILRTYEKYGVNFVQYLNGMFAIAIIDHNTNELHLVRDRLGVKPLFFYQNENIFAFSSELKSFLEIPTFNKEINYSSIYHYLNFNYIPVPQTIFKNVLHVKPGTFLTVNISSQKITEKCYWDLANTPEVITSEAETMERLEYLIEDATKIRLRSDVPIGAFLSGGLDSSLVCAVMKKKFNYSPETFTIGFKEAEFDEAVYAKQLADFLDLKNEVVYMSSEAVSLWPQVTWFNDQPHGDISFIPTYMVAKAAAQKYKVVFSGDGGDEAFGGYLKYLSLIDEKSLGANYFSGISLFDEFKTDDHKILTDSFLSKVEIGSSYKLFQEQNKKFDHKDVINQGILFDVKNLLPGNNLVKPDRMAMANSLEVRSPLLDYRIYELMFDLPGNLKISKELGTKHLLKKLALNYLPENLVYRKKQMFTVPVGEWFKGPLNKYLSDNLLDSKFTDFGIFKVTELKKMIQEHTDGQRNYTRELRAILNLKLWFDKFIIGDK